ncbi:uncharacterized protein LOC123524494 [Mercenaria mercenaria]|uniref:uncharacterized protein LOC123524494 n=1 Tax=Mercenaria mercenaria TaxID=6596 RepID=UPI00234EE6CD|nr:uncharacterized protein LOC123524494 [Mercenaria mercenaria]
MYLCNAGVGLSNGNVHINFTDCNKRTSHDVTNQTSLTLKDDANGAMQYTVAVVFVYSIAVLGVFGLGLYNRRKHRRNHVDNETRAFLKNYEDVRRICEQKSRLGAIQALLHQIHNEQMTNCTDSSVNNLALLPFSLSNISENTLTDFVVDGVTESNKKLLDEGTHKPEKGKGSPARAKLTLLGSSRRSYKECKRCWSRRGVVTTYDKCMCRFYDDLVTGDSGQLTETVDLSNIEEMHINSENCEKTFNNVSFQ